MTEVPARIRWAVGVVAPGPAERILEIGCGPGVAAGLVCERLTSGHLLAIDRSPVAVARTVKRNAEHVAAGRLEVRESTLDDLVASGVDKAFSVNVNVFWTTNPTAELATLRRALRVGGELFILYGTNPTGTDKATRPVTKALTDHGFTDITTLRSPAGIGFRGVRGG